jgi:hypothetical protein
MYNLPMDPNDVSWTPEGEERLQEQALRIAALRADFDDYELLQDVAMGQLSGGRY